MGKIQVNDQPREVDTPIALLKLIELNRVLQSDMVSVQLNGVFVEREAFEVTVVGDGDAVDFLYFMGGGGR